MRKLFFFILSMIILSSIATAVDFIPQGNINGVNLRNIYQFKNITSDLMCDNSGFCANVSNLAFGNSSGDISGVTATAPYILGGGVAGTVSISFNESKLNATIDSRSGGSGGAGNCSVSGSCSSVVYDSDFVNRSIIRSGNVSWITFNQNNLYNTSQQIWSNVINFTLIHDFNISWITSNQNYNTTEELVDAVSSVLAGPQEGVLVEYIDVNNWWQFTVWSNITRDTELDNKSIIRSGNVSWITSNQNNFGNCSVSNSCGSILYVNNESDLVITESQISDLSHTVDTFWSLNHLWIINVSGLLSVNETTLNATIDVRDSDTHISNESIQISIGQVTDLISSGQCTGDNKVINVSVNGSGVNILCGADETGSGSVGKEGDKVYLYNTTTVMFFNESKLNLTIDARSTGITSSEFDNKTIIRSGNVSWITLNQLYGLNSSTIFAGDVTGGYQSLSITKNYNTSLELWNNIINYTLIHDFNISWILNNQAYGLNASTSFGGEVSGTYSNLVLSNTALDDQYVQLTDKLFNSSQEIWSNVINYTLIHEFNVSWVVKNQAYGLNSSTNFAGDITGTYQSLSITKNYNTSQELWNNVINTTIIKSYNTSWITKNQNVFVNNNTDAYFSQLGVNVSAPTSNFHSVGSFNISSNGVRQCYSNSTCAMICKSGSTEFSVCD